MDTGRGLSRKREGQTLVETALIIALLLAVLFGIIEFGRAWFYSNQLNNSVRAAARYGAVLGNSSTSASKVDAYVRREISAFIPPDGIVSVSVRVFDKTTHAQKDPVDAQHGDTLEVSVVYDFKVLSGSIIPYFHGDKLIARSASMLIE